MVKLIENLNLLNVERGIKETLQDQLTIRNCKINGTRIGLDITACKEVDIQNCDIGGQGTWGGEKYAYGLRLGFSGQPALSNGLVRIVNSSIQDLGTPSSDYSKNRDIIALEGGELWAKDSNFGGASDAVIDGKGTFRLQGCTMSNAHRLLRMWGGTTNVISNCTLTSAQGHKIAWFKDKTSKLIVHNCTFDGQPLIPLNKIDGEDFNAASQVFYVTDDPLKDIPWFNAIVNNDAEILLHVRALAKLLRT